MKKIKLIILLSFIISIAQGQNLKWIHFEWVGDSIGDKYFDKEAILIPMEVENLPYRFIAQFDLGAPSTMFYGNAVAPVLATHPQLKSKIDTSVFVWIQSTKNPVLKRVGLKLDHVSFGKRDIALFKDFGDSLTVDSLKSNTVKHIGTIGADLFRDKVLIIDYPGNRLAVTDKVPQVYIDAKFLPMKIDNGRIKIPFTISDSTYDVMFDTGASFDLGMDEENIKHCIAPGSPVLDSIEGESWGVKHTVYGRRINNLKVGGTSFPDAIVYESPGEDWVRFHKNENIIGEAGNSLFLKTIMIIDYRNRRFGVK